MTISVVCKGSLSVLGRARGQTECDRANASGGRRLKGDFLRSGRRKATTSQRRKPALTCQGTPTIANGVTFCIRLNGVTSTLWLDFAIALCSFKYQIGRLLELFARETDRACGHPPLILPSFNQ